MAIHAGLFEAIVVSNNVGQTEKGSAYVQVDCQLPTGDDDIVPLKIWLTEKAIGMARPRLRSLGFDVDRDDLATLAEDQARFKGRKILVSVEDKGQYGWQADFAKRPPSKDTLAALTRGLRAAKKSGAAEPDILPDASPDQTPF